MAANLSQPHVNCQPKCVLTGHSSTELNAQKFRFIYGMAKVRDCMQIGRTYRDAGFMICAYFDTPTLGRSGLGGRAISIESTHAGLRFAKAVSDYGAALDHNLHVFKLLDVIKWISR